MSELNYLLLGDKTFRIFMLRGLFSLFCEKKYIGNVSQFSDIVVYLNRVNELFMNCSEQNRSPLKKLKKKLTVNLVYRFVYLISNS